MSEIDLKNLRLSSITYFIFMINQAHDTGRHNDIGVEEVWELIEAGGLLNHLSERLGDDTDLSVLTESDQGQLLETALTPYINTAVPEDWGVQRDGLCLMVAMAAELIQVGWRDTDSKLDQLAV